MIPGAEKLIRRFGKTYVVQREVKSGEYVEGKWVGNTRVETFEIVASVQPIDGDEIERLPEAQRSKEMRTLYTVEKLKTVSERLGRKADVVIIDDQEWEVGKVEAWGPLLNHSKCVILRTTTDEGVRSR